MDHGKKEKINEAERMYLLGEKLVDIAHKLDVPEGTVRRWKSTYKWGSEKSERSDNQKANVRSKKRAKKVEPAAEVESISENSELTDKQRLFCVYYIRCFNATKAYQKAYGCDYKSALAAGPRMLGNVRIKSEINRLKSEKLNREFFSEEDVFQRYMDIAFADMNDYVEIVRDTIRFKDSNNFDGSLIKKVSCACGKVNSIEMLDAMQALKWLSEHMDMATEEQKARIAVMKAKVTSGDADETADDGFLDALNATAGEDWSDEEN